VFAVCQRTNQAPLAESECKGRNFSDNRKMFRELFLKNEEKKRKKERKWEEWFVVEIKKAIFAKDKILTNIKDEKLTQIIIPYIYNNVYWQYCHSTNNSNFGKCCLRRTGKDPICKFGELDGRWGALLKN
jgi:hypothetical protein